MQCKRLSVFICRALEASVILAIFEGPVCLIGCRFRRLGKGWGEARLSSYAPFYALQKSLRKELIYLQIFGEGEGTEGVLQGLSIHVGKLFALFNLRPSSVCPHAPDHTMGFVDTSCALAARCRPETAPREVRSRRC